jgi:hypothetical protein
MVLKGKLEEKRPLGRPKLRLEDNTKVAFREIGWGWCGIGQEPV